MTDAARERELEDALRSAYTLLERATVDAHDHAWSLEVMAQIRKVLGV